MVCSVPRLGKIGGNSSPTFRTIPNLRQLESVWVEDRCPSPYASKCPAIVSCWKERLTMDQATPPEDPHVPERPATTTDAMIGALHHGFPSSEATIGASPPGSGSSHDLTLGLPEATDGPRSDTRAE